MGFVLEELAPQQHELLPTQLKNAVESTTLLIATLSKGGDDEFDTALERTPPRLVAAVQRFAKVLYEAGASTRIVGDDNRLALSTDEIGRLSRRLSEIHITEEIGPVDGVLLGVLPEARKFELKLPGEGSGTIVGAISEDLAFKYTSDTAFKERLLLQPVRAQVKVLRTFRNGRLVWERRVLESLEPTTSG